MIAVIRCPFCGFEQRRERTSHGKTITLWDSEEGGCDKEYAFEIGYEIRVSYFTLTALEVTNAEEA